MRQFINVILFISCVLAYLDFYVCGASDDLSTIEPEASTGCPAPDLRFTSPRKEGTTTESPYAEFETTQIYLPEDFTTADIEFVENVDIDISSSTLDELGDGEKKHSRYAELNPYRVDTEMTDDGDVHDSDGLIRGHDASLAHGAGNTRRRGKKRRFTPGKRRRVETEHGGGGRDRHGRYERHAGVVKREIHEKQHLHLIPPPLGKVYYIESVDLLSAAFLNKTKMSRSHKHKNKTRSSMVSSSKDSSSISNNHPTENELHPNKGGRQEEQQPQDVDKHQNEHKDYSNESNDNNKEIKNSVEVNSSTSTSLSDTAASSAGRGIGIGAETGTGPEAIGVAASPNTSHPIPSGDVLSNDEDVKQTETFDLLGHHDVNESKNTNNLNQSEADQNVLLQRVKRKSGKTTGALSRPKGGGDSGSKTTSRKGDKGGYDEEGGNVPFHPDEEESSEEESEESDEITHFSHVSEIRFPGEVGPLGDRRLCKIRCVKGKWVGPLCATNEEDDHGNVKFQPLYKSCHVNRVPPHLLLSYRNISVNVGWDLPHGHSLQARCKDLGLYKLLGESRVLCSNGLWAPRMPSCVPTTLLTNYSDDSPPSIRIKIGAGSGAFEPSGVLAVLPGSTIHLDCMYPRRRGTPEWTWTGWFNQANPVGWSTIPEEKATKYRLTIKDIQNQDSGTYTCASPRGLTNSIVIVVATSQCPQLPDPASPLSLRLEGNKLGQRALYRCPLGYTIDGTANSTCLASGNWSSPPPVCHPVQCPPLFLEDPHLSLTELNTSAWGRAVFKCSWGFRLSGPPGLECEPTGVWSGPVPRCRAIQCPQPLVPINGRIDGTSGSSSHRRYAVGALVTFSCTEGHLLVGEASIVCTETGFWSHPPPFCKSQCPYPGDPPNGLIAPLKFHYDPGDLLSVQCRPGFVEYGANGPPERPRCLPDGNWSGPVPQCRSYEEV